MKTYINGMQNLSFSLTAAKIMSFSIRCSRQMTFSAHFYMQSITQDGRHGNKKKRRGGTFTDEVPLRRRLRWYDPLH